MKWKKIGKMEAEPTVALQHRSENWQTFVDVTCSLGATGAAADSATAGAFLSLSPESDRAGWWEWGRKEGRERSRTLKLSPETILHAQISGSSIRLLSVNRTDDRRFDYHSKHSVTQAAQGFMHFSFHRRLDEFVTFTPLPRKSSRVLFTI